VHARRTYTYLPPIATFRPTRPAARQPVVDDHAAVDVPSSGVEGVLYARGGHNGGTSSS